MLIFLFQSIIQLKTIKCFDNQTNYYIIINFNPILISIVIYFNEISIKRNVFLVQNKDFVLNLHLRRYFMLT